MEKDKEESPVVSMSKKERLNLDEILELCADYERQVSRSSFFSALNSIYYFFLHLFFRSSVSSERPSSNSSFALRKQNRVRSLSPSRSLPSLSSAPPSTSGSSGGGGSRKRRGRRRRRRSLPRWQPSRNCQTSSCSCRCHRNPPQCLRLIQMPTEEKIPLPLPLPKQGRRRSRRIAPLFFPLPPLPPRRLLLPLSRSPALRGETSLQPSRPRLRPHKTILPPRPRPPPRVSPSPQTGRTI